MPQPKPLGPQPGELLAAWLPWRDPVSTLTAPKLRSAWREPQRAQVGVTPSEYAEIERRMPNRWPQSWQI